MKKQAASVLPFKENDVFIGEWGKQTNSEIEVQKNSIRIKSSVPNIILIIKVTQRSSCDGHFYSNSDALPNTSIMYSMT